MPQLTPPTKSHRATGRVTLSDVARAAGVSPSTVSRALRGERAVDPALIERVMAVSGKLGYVPDPAARSSKGGGDGKSGRGTGGSAGGSGPAASRNITGGASSTDQGCACIIL